MSQPQLWKYNETMSTADRQIYSHTFPVLKYNKKTTVLGEFLWDSNINRVFINVYDCNNNTIYTPYYNRKYGNYDPILSKIENIINRELKRLGVEDVNDYHI